MDTLFGILGTTSLRIDGEPRDDWGPPRQRAILGALLVNAGQSMSITQLLTWAWPQDAPLPRHPRTTLDSYATKIRHTLERLGLPDELHGKNGGYRFEVDRQLIDYHRFRDLMASARRHVRDGDPEQASAVAARALHLWRGPFLEDLRSEPAGTWRTRVAADELAPAHATFLEARFELGEYDEVLANLHNAQVDYPRDLTLVKLRLSTLRKLARDNEATSYYLTTWKALREDGDEQAAEHLRGHHERLLAEATRRPVPPPAAPADAGRMRPRGLPHDLIDFCGRRDLLRELDAATTTADGELLRGVVILDGMGGVGKTALAVHWGHRVRSRFSGGELFVNLHGFSADSVVGHDAVVEDFLIALGKQPDKTTSPRSREVLLRQALADRHTLVILDNARDFAHIKNLVPLLSDCLVIVTSRRRLTSLSAWSGARRVRVSPMSRPEAEALVALRLGSRRQEVNADWLAACGGLPLVINLAAEHLATHGDGWPPAATTQDKRRMLLDIGEDGDGANSPRAILTWSYLVLDEPTRLAFRRLGLHPGADFGFDAAIACVARTAEETRVALTHLVAAHLLHPAETSGRYRFHDLLWELAAKQAAVDESPAEKHDTERRILDFYLRSAVNADAILYPGHRKPPPLSTTSIVTPVAFTDPAIAQAWFARERANLNAALEMAARTGHHGHAWRLAHTMQTYYDRHGHHRDGMDARKTAAEAARLDGQREAEASSLFDVGRALLDHGELTEAQSYLEAGRRYAEEERHDQAMTAVLNQLGRLESLRGNQHAAIQFFQQCLSIARKTDDNEALCWAHCNIGAAFRAIGRLDEATLHLHQAQYIAERDNNRSALASTLIRLALIHRDHADTAVAAGYATQALAIAEAIPDLPLVAEISVESAAMHAAGTRAAAMEHARKAVDVCTSIHHIPFLARALDILAGVLLAQGEPTEATVAWRRAQQIYLQMNNAAQATLVQAKLDKLPAHIPLPTARTKTSLANQPPQGDSITS
ncbi:AfsR/SARP family transcriptional regulator [Actinokineospora iranica]|uniref:AfsR/SARP family transcriptional regulator n=1 Tax=Actinokineospora iranica TaxID=1271860 RepID=UPI0011144D09|nr:BTAD domain-containing putative transcriptional regulator [Actinokineospora iranica]